MSNSIKETKYEDIINSFIDDLNNEKKPKVYMELEDKDLEELESYFETVRAIKRLRKSDTKSLLNRNKKNKKERKRIFPIIKIAAVAAVFLITFVAGSFLDIPFLDKQLQDNKEFSILNSDNIVHAMVKAYEELKSYAGVIEIRSINNGEVDFLETIQVKYKKPNKYIAIHEYDGYSYKQISNGDKLYTVTADTVTVDYSNPRKELWRYHIEDQIQELTIAEEIRKVGSENLLGREADVFEYRFSDSETFHKIWVDKETNLPLKKELNLPENRKLINHFIELEVNPEFDDMIFSYELEPQQKLVELNHKVDVDSVKKVWGNTDRLQEEVPDSFELVNAVKLENEVYDYLVKFSKDKDYIDVYITNKPITDYYSTDSEYGKLGDGWVEITEDAVNVFKVYIGKSNVLKWVTENMEIVIVSNIDTDSIVDLLERVEQKEIVPISVKELEDMGVKPTITKEGH
jgi:outer membrane lipoprotein-sorting protein/predicted house-cleaning noncanonical NTP pyrophosphatase (MazG superfamily)